MVRFAELAVALVSIAGIGANAAATTAAVSQGTTTAASSGTTTAAASQATSTAVAQPIRRAMLYRRQIQVTASLPMTTAIPTSLPTGVSFQRRQVQQPSAEPQLQQPPQQQQPPQSQPQRPPGQSSGSESLNSTTIRALISSKTAPFQIMYNALSKTGIAKTLDDSNKPYTLFAPIDDAFMAVPPPVARLIMGTPETAEMMLLYHLHRGADLPFPQSFVKTLSQGGASQGQEGQQQQMPPSEQQTQQPPTQQQSLKQSPEQSSQTSPQQPPQQGSSGNIFRADTLVDGIDIVVDLAPQSPSAGEGAVSPDQQRMLQQPSPMQSRASSTLPFASEAASRAVINRKVRILGVAKVGNGYIVAIDRVLSPLGGCIGYDSCKAIPLYTTPLKPESSSSSQQGQQQFQPTPGQQSQPPQQEGQQMPGQQTQPPQQTQPAQQIQPTQPSQQGQQSQPIRPPQQQGQQTQPSQQGQQAQMQ